MKIRIVVLALLVAVSCARFEPFTFVQMSDTQIGFWDDSPAWCHSDSLMKAAVDAANALNPACVIITGDLVDNPAEPLQDSIFTTRLKEIEAPVYTIPGNHDYHAASEQERLDYIALRGSDRFSFKDKGCAFIGINSNIIKEGSEELEAEQWTWLGKALAAARGCRYTFVFLHHPIVREALDEEEDYFNFPVGKRRKYIDLFKQYGVDIVFSGHCHQEYEAEGEGMSFITAGPVCNPLGHGYPGFNVVKVGRDGVEVKYKASLETL